MGLINIHNQERKRLIMILNLNVNLYLIFRNLTVEKFLEMFFQFIFRVLDFQNKMEKEVLTLKPFRKILKSKFSEKNFEVKFFKTSLYFNFL